MKGVTKTVLAVIALVAADDSCGKYAAYGDDALEGCKMCQKYFAQDVDKCMSCGTACFERVCKEKTQEECIQDPAFMKCDQTCLMKRDEPKAPFSPNATCEKFAQWGEDAVKGCLSCAEFFPSPIGFRKCLGCGKKCWKEACEGKDVVAAECAKSADFEACDNKCINSDFKEDMYDPEDCYFDKECHKLVDWDKITLIKKGFFGRLKMLKRLGAKNGNNNVMVMMEKVHGAFVKAGMPEDRVDYILKKWVMNVYPEAFATAEQKKTHDAPLESVIV